LKSTYNYSRITSKEAEDKEFVKLNMYIYRPSDYHLLLNDNLSFSLDASEEVNYSRPSIDVSFESFFVLKKTVVEFYYQEQIKMGQGFKMIAENGNLLYKIVMKRFIDATFGN
jgi:two-component system chemotaxis response regulator CheB